MALSLLAHWQAAGVLTHVLIVPTATSETTRLADMLAAAGGTGAGRYPGDPPGFASELGAIVASLSPTGDPCQVSINPAASDPDAVRLVVAEGGQDFEVPRVGAGHGLRGIAPDGSNATLGLDVCSAVQVERFRLEYGCEALPSWSK